MLNQVVSTSLTRPAPPPPPALRVREWSTSYSPFGRCPPNRIKPKYGMLVARQIGRLRQAKQSSRFYFELIPTPDNLRACQIALELLTEGEAVAHKDPAAISAVHLGTTSVNHPLREVKVAKRKRAARADELAGIIEGLQTV